MFRRHIEPHLVGIGADCLKAATCAYTVTPDSAFVIDRLPGHERVLIASPCSGHGFKHSAAIGEALAQWAIAETPDIDLSAFSLGRFGN